MPGSVSDRSTATAYCRSIMHVVRTVTAAVALSPECDRRMCVRVCVVCAFGVTVHNILIHGAAALNSNVMLLISVLMKPFRAHDTQAADEHKPLPTLAFPSHLGGVHCVCRRSLVLHGPQCGFFTTFCH